MLRDAIVIRMSQDELARWRGENIGIIFRFLQMLPSLTRLNNVTLPMELAGKYAPKERRGRAMGLLELVGLADQANKLPGAVSGGQPGCCRIREHSLCSS